MADCQKRELAEILLSDIKVANQKVQSIQFKPAFQRMYLSPKKLDFQLWSIFTTPLGLILAKFADALRGGGEVAASDVPAAFGGGMF